MKVSYRYFQNPTQQAQVQKIVEKYRAFIPKDLQELDIAIYAAAEDCTASVNISGIKYRRAAVDIYYLFFDQTQEQQEQDILHELVHIHQAVLLNIISDDLLPLVKNEQLKEYLERHISKAIEYQTQGLAQGVYNALHPPAVTFGPSSRPIHSIPQFQPGSTDPNSPENRRYSEPIP